MNGVIGMAHLLRDTGLDAEQRDLVDTLCGSGDTLLAIINDILDFSKIEAGRMELEACDFELGRVVANVLGLQGTQIGGKPLRLVCDVAPDVPAWVRGDPTRLRQVLFNLVGNAVKFTAAGEVAVRVRREAGADYEAGVTRLRFEVRDTGIGISPDALRRVFEPFVQADESTTRRFGGTGLGLAICKRIIALMGGALEVESECGRGSVFSFTVSLAEAARAVPAAAPRPEAELPSGLRILVAEDNPVNQKVVRMQLGRLGLEAEFVGDGHAAIAALRETPFDVVLMDACMPGLDGLEATRRIRRLQSDPATALPSSPAIVAMTANALSSDREDCLAAGMDDYVAKPMTLAALRATLLRNLPLIASPIAA